MKKKTGTKQWAGPSWNIQHGCEHDCRYCWARGQKARFPNMRVDNWAKPKAFTPKAKMPQNETKLPVMFPTTHDISAGNLQRYIETAKALLDRNNRLLIVSKPHPQYIQYLTDALSEYKSRIMLRFSIGTDDEELRKFWEPEAPPIEQRMACLKFTMEQGWNNSASVEPMLDVPNIERLIQTLDPFVTHTIWLGTMDMRWSPKTPEEVAAKEQIKLSQTPEIIRDMWNNLKPKYPKLRAKDKIQKILGLEITPDTW